jgi:hypothetical protein
MDFRNEIANIRRFGHQYGYYCVPIPFLRPEFAHAATTLTVWNDGVGGLLALTGPGGLWYPFWPQKANERFPDLPDLSDETRPAICQGYPDWKDACIAALNPVEHVFPKLQERETQGIKTWMASVELLAAALRDPFVADVNETLLVQLKKIEAGDEKSDV